MRPLEQSQGQTTNRWLDPVGGQAASEGSLSLTVAGSLGAEQIQRSCEGRGVHERVVKGGG